MALFWSGLFFCHWAFKVIGIETSYIRINFFLYFILISNKGFVSTEKTVIPKSVNDMKLIHAGKVLENSKTLAESRVTFGDLPSGVITMHVVVQPPVAKKKTG